MADLRSRLAALAAFAEELEASDFEVGHWHPMEPVSPGSDVLTLPWYELGPRAEAFVEVVGANGWVVAFDWMAWQSTPEAIALRDDRAALAAATPEQLTRLLTMLFREDRFAEGALGHSLKTGLMAAITRRARTLVEAMDGLG